MQTPTFEEARPADYLMRLAASDLGRAYKALAVSEMAIRPGDVVLDLGCGPGADLPAFARAAGSDGRVIGVDNDPDAVRQATDRTAGLPQVEVREGDARALGLPAEGFTDFTARPRRLQRFLRAYGWSATTGEFLEVVQARVQAHADAVRDLAGAGDEVSGRLLRQGVADNLDQAIAELASFPQ